MTLTFVNYTDGLSLDDIEITLDASDNNPVSNWNFEDGLDGWQTKGTVTLTNAADTDSQAVQLADQSEVHQTIAVQPDTDYIATVRMKVDTEDTFSSTEQYSLDGSTLMGCLRNQGDGPYFYTWQRQVLYTPAQARVVLITNMENHLDDLALYEAMKAKADPS